jgi:hypothetical protein
MLRPDQITDMIRQPHSSNQTDNNNPLQKDIKSLHPLSSTLSTNVQSSPSYRAKSYRLFYMLDYLLSRQPPGKGEDLTDSGLSTIIANLALVVGVVILKPAVEQHFRVTIEHYISLTLNNRQSLKAVVDARRDLLSPALDGLGTLHLNKPAQATIASAVTVVKFAPTPVQVVQEQSTMGPTWGIFACAMLALVGTVLAFQHHRQASSFGWSSPSAASSSGSSLQPFSRDSTPPADDFSDEPSDSDGHPPPLPTFDIFYDPLILSLDKAVDIGDKKGVRDMDGAPPPPPPSSPTPVEDGDAFKNKSAIFRWSSLTLVLSIISFVINRFFKSRGKTHKVSTPIASESITVNEISANVTTVFPSAAAKHVIKSTPVIKSTYLNLLRLVEIGTESPTVNAPTLVMSLVSHPVSQRSRKFMNAVFSLLVMVCLHRLPFIAEYLLDYHLKRTMNLFFPTPIRGRSLEALDVIVENVCDLFFLFGHVLINSRPDWRC